MKKILILIKSIQIKINIFFSWLLKVTPHYYGVLKIKIKSLIQDFLKFADSAESILKKIFYFFILVLLVFIFINNLIKLNDKTLYIDPTGLPEEILKKGLSPKEVTQNTILNLNEFFSDEVSENSIALNQFIVRNKLAVDECSKDTLIINQTSLGQFLDYKIRNNDRNIDIKLHDGIFPISISGSLRKLFNVEGLNLTPKITNYKNGDNFQVQVLATFNSKHSHISELSASSIEDAMDKLTLLLIKYIDPMLYVNLLSSTNPDEALDAISLHLKYYPKLENKIEFLIQKTFITTSKYNFNVSSKEKVKKELREISIDIQTTEKKTFEDKFFAKYANFFINYFINLDSNVVRKLSKKEIGFLEDVVFEKWIFDNPEKKTYFNYILSDLVNKIGTDEYRQSFNTKLMNSYPNDLYVLTGYIEYLIDTDNIARAREVLKMKSTLKAERDAFKNLKSSYNIEKENYFQKFLLVKIQLLLRPNQAKELKETLNQLNSCGYYSLLETLHDYYLKAYLAKDNTNLATMSNLIAYVHNKAESKGVLSKSLYENFGDILFDSKKFGQSIVQYKKALEFTKDKSNLFNKIGESLYLQKEYKEAEVFLKKSIALDVNSRNVETYLDTLNEQSIVQRNDSKFLSEYYKFRYDLNTDVTSYYFLTQAAHAQCALNKRDALLVSLSELEADHYKPFIEEDRLDMLKRCSYISD